MLSAIAVVASVKMRPIRFPCLTTLMTAAAVVTTLILTTLNGVSSVTGEHQNGKRSSNESAAFSAVKSSRWPKLVDRHRRPRFVRETLLSTVYETFYHSDCVFIFFLLPVFFWIFSLFCSGRNQMTSRNLVETSTRQLSRNTFHSRYSCRTANEGQQLEHVLMTTSDDYSTSPDVCFGALLSKKAFTAYPLPSSPSFTDDE